MNIGFDTQAGSSRPNEDWVGAIPEAVVVLDGVTPPPVSNPGCTHSVPWFTNLLGKHLLALVQEDRSLADALAAAIDLTNGSHGSCDLTGMGTPAAAVAVLRRRGTELEYLVLADTSVVVDTTSGGVQVITDDRVRYADPGAIERTLGMKVGSPEHARSVAEMSVTQLVKRNVPDGYWVASTDPQAAENAITGRIPVASVRRVAVLTDGASCVVDAYRNLQWGTMLDWVQDRGPRNLISHIRKLERSDPEGAQWPRFKPSDDATVALLEP